jgi:transposase
MQAVATMGLEIAKSVLQVHRVDAAGQVLIRRHLKRPTSWRSSRNCQYV